jgi:hypothetical protein
MKWENLLDAIARYGISDGRFAEIAHTITLCVDGWGEALRALERAEARQRVLEWEGVWLWT